MASHKTPRFSHQSQEATIPAEVSATVIPAAYALAKAKSEHEAIMIMQTIPRGIYAALRTHMNGRPNLFLPEVRKAVDRIVEAPKMSRAEALFA
jgi:hypothetical protein